MILIHPNSRAIVLRRASVSYANRRQLSRCRFPGCPDERQMVEPAGGPPVRPWYGTRTGTTRTNGKCMACTHKIKFIEVSVAINHNVDTLLAGVLSQIRLKKVHCALQGHREPSPSAHWYKNRNVVRASMKARQMITWIFGKEDSKFRNCENLQVL